MLIERMTTMKTSLLPLNVAILLSSVAFLTGIARLILDVRFVPEVFNAMPENQPSQAALVMVLFVALFGGWLWALLSATRNNRSGLIALLIFDLLMALGWGLSTVVAFCPTPCAVAWPLTDVVTWSNMIVGLLAALTVVLSLRSRVKSIKAG
jgi:hypothetical protein